MKMTLIASTTELRIKSGETDITFYNRCPHQNKRLYEPTEEAPINDGYLVCQHHGAVFDVQTGECVSGPCMNLKLDRVQQE